MTAHARLNDEFTENEKCHDLITWLIVSLIWIGSKVKSSFQHLETSLFRKDPKSVIVKKTSFMLVFCVCLDDLVPLLDLEYYLMQW